MPVSVVVGGQFGSEGKGKVALQLARDMSAAAVVRVGGPNSGHTVYGGNNRRHIFRMLPTAAILADTLCVIPAGAYIDVDVLLREVASVGLAESRLAIDPNAAVVTPDCRDAERQAGLKERIGSTLSGTGAAVLNRIRRDGSAVLASEDERLGKYLRPTRPVLRQLLSLGDRIVVEGTQGFGLSLLHSAHYPKVTSRDTTAAAFVSEAGLSPLDVDDIVLVIRACPIRVPGDSGPLPNETTWQSITTESGATHPIEEFTSVTQRRRRVARYDPGVVLAAIEANAPNRIVLNHVDYIDSRARVSRALTAPCLKFVAEVERSLERTIDYVGVGPNDLLPRRVRHKLAESV